jgi:signal peptidase I
MRRAEDISFDYNKDKNADDLQKSEIQKKESFVIDVKKLRKNKNEKKPEGPVIVKESKSLWEIIYEWMDSFVFSIILILLVFVFCFRVVGVDGESMMPTLNHGDWLTVKAINTTIERGDIVVITQPNALNEPLIKRVIAVGGDTLDIDFGTGVVEVNGEAIEEPYIMEQTRNQGDFDKPIRIPEGYVFVMGDNRNNSLDSRFDSISIIDERYILGVANARMYPFGEWEIY